MPLNPKGPYLLYLDHDVEDWLKIQPIIANPDGSGATRMDLPSDARLTAFEIADAISPTGEWLVFHTGSVDKEHTLTLNLAHIPDGQVRVVTPLLSETYPDNLDELAERWPAELPDLFAPDIGWRSIMDISFDDSLYAYAWSPDGRYLAFSGQLDGPSSDVYMFDLAIGEIRRLTDDILNTSYLHWSPDGQWLLQFNSVPGMTYDGGTLHRLDPRGGLQHPAILEKGAFWVGLGWLSDHRYLLTHIFDGASGDFWYLDLDTQELKNLWSASYEAYGYNPDVGTIYVAALVNTERDALVATAGDGLYLVDLDGHLDRFIDQVFWQLTFRGGEASRMYASDGERLYGIDGEGNVAVVSDRDNVDVAVSPDRRWAAVFAGDTVELLDTHDALVKTISVPDVLGVRWRPDSQGFYVVQCHALSHYSLTQDELAAIAEGNDQYCEYSPDEFLWVPASPPAPSP